MDLNHNPESADGVRFDDHGCFVHSRSYYCQSRSTTTTTTLPTCGEHYTCQTAGWVMKSGVETLTPPTEADCCESTCTAYTCTTTGWALSPNHASATNPTETECCETTCAAWTCSVNEGFVAKTGTDWVPGDVFNPSNAICCDGLTWMTLSGMTTSQSSISHSPQPNVAIDGNSDSSWGSSSCTHTNSETEPWWQIDFGSTVKVLAIEITNRGDCCSQRLDSFSVDISGNDCISGESLGSGETKMVECQGTGRDLRVYKANSGEAFTICEVRIAYQPNGVQYADLTTGASYSQSSISHSPQPPVAVDGNWDSSWGSSSCTHTGNDANPWWQVDLGSQQTVTAIEIQNRGGCCGERLDGFTVTVDGQVCVSDEALPQGEVKYVQCGSTLTGSSIKVSHEGYTGAFTICEFAAISHIDA